MDLQNAVYNHMCIAMRSTYFCYVLDLEHSNHKFASLWQWTLDIGDHGSTYVFCDYNKQRK